MLWNKKKKAISDNLTGKTIFVRMTFYIKDGEFAEQINQISDGYGEVLNLKHYVVITQNYNIDIVTEWEPTIEISKI